MQQEGIIADSTDNVIYLFLYCSMFKHIKPMDKECFLYPSILCVFLFFGKYGKA